MAPLPQLEHLAGFVLCHARADQQRKGLGFAFRYAFRDTFRNTFRNNLSPTFRYSFRFAFRDAFGAGFSKQGTLTADAVPVTIIVLHLRRRVGTLLR